jgi:RNA polymerase sigma-70 factor (ECF subfamily)
LVDEALDASPTGVYVVLAAIAREHSCAPSWAATNWSEILRLYDVMLASWPSPVVALNRAVAVGFSRGPVAGARELDALAGEPRLAAYPYYPAARADFARQLGDVALAAMYYQEALVLSTNDVERAFLERRLVELGPL